MGIDAYRLNPFTNDMGPVPDPPPMPKYDPKEEAPMWNWRRIYNVVVPMPGSDLWPNVGSVPKDDDKPDWRGVIKNNIEVWPNPGPYKYGQKQYPYFWFDTPDYADPFKKLWWSFKWSLFSGYGAWSFMCMVKKDPLTWAGQKRNVAKYALPVVAIGMTGSLAVVTIANLRGCVDDYWNYAIAGGLTALFMGRNNFHKGVRYMFVLPTMALIAKNVAENNTHLFPTMNQRAKSLNVSGASTEYGPKSSDFRFGFRVWGKAEKTGRDVRDLSQPG